MLGPVNCIMVVAYPLGFCHPSICLSCYTIEKARFSLKHSKQPVNHRLEVGSESQWYIDVVYDQDTAGDTIFYDILCIPGVFVRLITHWSKFMWAASQVQSKIPLWTVDGGVVGDPGALRWFQWATTMKIKCPWVCLKIRSNVDGSS